MFFQEQAGFNVKRLGQVFTPPGVVKKMISLRQNKGSLLEPSSGKGAFSSKFKNIVSIEIDKNIVKDKNTLVCDFFKYSTQNQFQTIIGNPPYVRFQDIPFETKKILSMDLFDKRSNLYLFFIEKCVKHLTKGGELIFITPRDFLKSTNSIKLNKLLYEEGSFTDFYELGDDKIFKGYSPNCAIWRWQKGLKNRKLSCGRAFFYSQGQIWFGKYKLKSHLSDYFDVKVGAVSGADHIFSNQKYGNVQMVCSETRRTKNKRVMIYNKKCGPLKRFKDELLSRKIKKFNENNWWEWGRKYQRQEGERIYVNCKTRQKDPFFISSDQAYDGSVLALFPKKKMNLSKAAQALNKTRWQDLGFVCGGRLIFSQRSLQNAPVNIL